MNLSKLFFSSLFQILSFVFVLGYFLGVLNIYFSDKNDYCLMTYMYEYPQYVKITVPENAKYPQYGLYAYSEGRFTEKARKMWFDGVPVLFLPGNYGSHKQARSLASVALRKAISGEYEYHFDYFTISYNEELSGLYGGVLEYQTEFAAACVHKILSLYKLNKFTKTVPESVILIGHSMGGLVAKSLLAYPNTLNSTNIAITLAAPLEAPVINVDAAMNWYYDNLTSEWEMYVNEDQEVKDKKILISLGSGVRDVLVPSVLTSSNDSFINALSTSIPGVWVSPNHVGIAWCKQLVMTINRFLFDIVDENTQQISENKDLLKAKARQYFQANRSMTLNPDVSRTTVTMLPDAFWFEDNRRIYQISRPYVEKTTYLMIRLVSFPQNRFLAVEALNLEDREWIYACNANFVYNTHRYCKEAIPLSELSRWSSAAMDFGKRKLATVHLHNLIEQYPEFSHVIVKVSPTRKPVVLNVDVNDYASRQITVDLPLYFLFGEITVKSETEKESLYYELILPNLNTVYQAYLLYVRPTSGCSAAQYHVAAELHVPWAKNHEYYHYFTHLKRSPMKLRLSMTNPNLTYGIEPTEYAKVTLLLDPKCTFSISITPSWYHRLAQFARNYSLYLFPFMCAIICLAARSNIRSLQYEGKCLSIHEALASESVKPYYVLVFARLYVTAAVSVTASLPILSYLELWKTKNPESEYFIRSVLVLPTYMVALGLLNIAAAAVVAVMVFSSQLAHRLLFRIIWRGGSNSSLAERVASGLQKVPMIVSVALVCSVPLSCGAAALVAGAAFYAFMISKMYEEYLEDYVYRLMAKVGSRLCKLLSSKSQESKNTSTTDIVPVNEISTGTTLAEESSPKVEKLGDESRGEKYDEDDSLVNENSQIELVKEQNRDAVKNEDYDEKKDTKTEKEDKCDESEESLSNLNFHLMMFFLWLAVTLINVPALMTWARNFKYNMVLRPDTSYYPGLAMSLFSSLAWQINGPKKNLCHYEYISTLLFITAVAIIVTGPFYLVTINYGITLMFVLICLQQALDSEIKRNNVEITNADKECNTDTKNISYQDKSSGDMPEKNNRSRESSLDRESNKIYGQDSGIGTYNSDTENVKIVSDDCACDENRIYVTIKNIKDKFSFSEEL